MKYPFTRILGWSHSRYQKFSECKRQYFYSYYSNFVDPSLKPTVAQLKSLTTIPMESGSIVHLLIKGVLERIQKYDNSPIDRNRFEVFSAQKVKESLTKLYFENYYLKQAIDFEEMSVKVNKLMAGFFESPIFEWINQEAYASKNLWSIDPEGYGETRIHDLKAYCIVDFLVPTNGKTYIIDWKTGSSKDHYIDQVKGYAVYAHQNLGIPISEIGCQLAYFTPSFEVQKYRFTEKEIGEFGDLVKEQTYEMYEYCQDREMNIPKPIEHFPMIEACSSCLRCNFKELCDR